MINEILLLASNGVLGVFLGAQITEAVLFLPRWKSLSSAAFFEFYETNGKKIHCFFSPLTIAATVFPLVATGYNLFIKTENPLLFLIMGLAALGFFSTYFLYFKKANKSFVAQGLSDDELKQELRRWGNWHWTRILLEFIAFGCALILLLKH